jgi:hypothetical protein
VRRTRLRNCLYQSSSKMEFEIIATSRGFPCIVLGAYKYRKIRETADGEIVWRCTKKSCLAQVRTNLEQSKILNVKDHHDHVGLDPYKLHRIKHQQSGRPALPLPGYPLPVAAVARRASECVVAFVMVSDVWKFCTKLSETHVRCNHCGRVMSYHGTTNLRVHIGRHFGLKPQRNRFGRIFKGYIKRKTCSCNIACCFCYRFWIVELF